MRIQTLVPLALALAALPGCKEDEKNGLPKGVREAVGTYGMPTDPTDAKATFSATLQILGVDGKIPAASVTVGGKTYTADAKGVITITGVSPTAPPRATLMAAGYVPLPLTLDFGSSGGRQRLVTMLKSALDKTFDAATGVTVKTGDAQLVIAASGVNTASGAAYTGTVTLSATYLDPVKEALKGKASVRAQLKSLPTTLALAKDASGKVSAVIPLVALNASLTGAKGETLQPASGKPAQVTLPLPAGSDKVIKSGSKTTLWSYDEKAGLFAANGECTVAVASDGSVTCAGTVKHFSTTTVATEAPYLSCARVSEVKLQLPSDLEVLARHDEIQLTMATAYPPANSAAATGKLDPSVFELPTETRYVKDSKGGLGYYSVTAAPGGLPVYFRVVVQLGLGKKGAGTPGSASLDSQKELTTVTSGWIRAKLMPPASGWKDPSDALDACEALTGEALVVRVPGPATPKPTDKYYDIGVIKPPDSGPDAKAPTPDLQPDALVDLDQTMSDLQPDAVVDLSQTTPDQATLDMFITDLPAMTSCLGRCAKVGICHGYPVPSSYATEAACVTGCQNGDFTTEDGITTCVAAAACTKAAMVTCLIGGAPADMAVE